MKRTFYHGFLAGAMLVSAAACQSSGSRNAANLEDTAAKNDAAQNSVSADIMNIHDKAMSKISQMRQLEQELNEAKVARVKAGKDTLQLAKASQALNYCDTAMFGWMQRYDTEQTGKTDDEKSAYEQEQLQLVKTLNASMDSSITAAKQLLNP
ncbi:hypothetical protein [Compostibacter hankyongensis]|uniref:Lipoprotein n=1 Tax=Compostibacter hankyongensis TaxID=1007089 RepID=A0ABP8FHI2_9BACT